MPTAVIFFIAVVATIVVGAIFSLKREKARTAAWQQAARNIGFDFQGQIGLQEIRAYADLALFDLGHSREAKNVLTGRTGDNDVRVFDYQYSVGHGGPKSGSHTWQQTIALYPGAGHSLPDFHLIPENPITRWAEKHGAYRDIDFNARPVFSSRYLLCGPDETAIRAAFTDGRMAFFEQQPGWVVDVKAGNVGIHRTGTRVKPADVGTFLAQSHEVVRALQPQ